MKASTGRTARLATVGMAVVGLVTATSAPAPTMGPALAASRSADATAPPPPGDPWVTATVLPALDGRTSGAPPPYVKDINNHGWVVGQSFGDEGSVPALWRGSSPTPLPTNRTGDIEAANRVNDRGQVAVSSYEQPYVWEDGESVDLPLPVMDVVDLDERGQVLLRRSGTTAAIWHDGEMTEIDAPNGMVAMSVYDLSDAGHVVGGFSRSGWTWDGGAYVWRRGRFTVLEPLGTASLVNRSGQVATSSRLWTGRVPRSLGITPWDMNERGQVVGNRDGRAYLWDDGRLTDLGTLGGATSQAEEVNERGQVVGLSQTADGRYHHFVWTSGQMLDLGVAWDGAGPEDINDRGQIIGRIRNVVGQPEGTAMLWQVHDPAIEDPGDPGAPGDPGDPGE